jgi:hypothetical protein
VVATAFASLASFLSGMLTCVVGVSVAGFADSAACVVAFIGPVAMFVSGPAALHTAASSRGTPATAHFLPGIS